VKRTDSDTTGEKQAAGKLDGSPEDVDMLVRSNDPRQLAIKSLLKTAPVSVDDKLATLKTAHHVDKDRFQSAFRSLMGTSKSRRS
jgi:hypothetical protein